MLAFERWFLALFAVAGAFFIAGIAGAIVADLAGFWYRPGAGFAAALAVVVSTYIVVPSRKFQLSCLALVVGTVAAWIILEPSWYPGREPYGAMAYQPTHLPFVATLSGGIAGLLLVALLRSLPRA